MINLISRCTVRTHEEVLARIGFVALRFPFLVEGSGVLLFGLFVGVAISVNDWMLLDEGLKLRVGEVGVVAVKHHEIEESAVWPNLAFAGGPFQV